jgi:hypothetical protein
MGKRGLINRFWCRPPRAGVRPSAMTTHELVTWAKDAADRRQYNFRVGYARQVLTRRDGITTFEACLILCRAGACFTFPHENRNDA